MERVTGVEPDEVDRTRRTWLYVATYFGANHSILTNCEVRSVQQTLMKMQSLVTKVDTKHHRRESRREHTRESGSGFTRNDLVTALHRVSPNSDDGE